MNVIRNSFIICGLTGVFIAQGVFAETTIITNVSSSAISGGNTGSNAIENVSTSKVYIETVVNGETVQLVDEEYSSDEGEVLIEKSLHYESEDVSVDNIVSAKADIFIEETDEVIVGNAQDNEEVIVMQQVGAVTGGIDIIEDTISIEREIVKEKQEGGGLLTAITHFFEYVFAWFV